MKDNDKMPLLWIMNRISTLPSSEASASVTLMSAGIISMGPHLNYMRNRMVLEDLEVHISLPNMLLSILVVNVSRKLTTVLNGIANIPLQNREEGKERKQKKSVTDLDEHVHWREKESEGDKNKQAQEP